MKPDPAKRLNEMEKKNSKLNQLGADAKSQPKCACGDANVLAAPGARKVSHGNCARYASRVASRNYAGRQK